MNCFFKIKEYIMSFVFQLIIAAGVMLAGVIVAHVANIDAR